MRVYMWWRIETAFPERENERRAEISRDKIQLIRKPVKEQKLHQNDE